jgi:hypothetical protein
VEVVVVVEVYGRIAIGLMPSDQAFDLAIRPEQLLSLLDDVVDV